MIKSTNSKKGRADILSENRKMKNFVTTNGDRLNEIEKIVKKEKLLFCTQIKKYLQMKGYMW